ncbi:MAG: hypothetical protein ACRD72_05170 [Candidatus Angelobacter sp.]|jgi:hypothetical protein
MSSAAESGFWEEVKFEWLVRLAWLIVPGVAIFFFALLTPSTDWVYALIAFAGVLLMVPCFIHLQLVAVWHWKARYIGDHSKLWGALFILETTGWFKLIYFFRHILPDRRNRGRYLRVAPPPVPASGEY